MAKSYSFDALGLLHAGTDESIANIAKLASQTLLAPIAYVSVLEKKKDLQHFAAAVSTVLDTSIFCEMSIEGSICKYVQRSNGTVTIDDVALDPRTAGNVFCRENRVRSYIGTPIHTPSGMTIGALCCMTVEPREWTPLDIDIIENLARCIDDVVKSRTIAREERTARLELQELLKTRADYVAHISHEIRTPLTGIAASIAMLDLATTKDRTDRLMAILKRSTAKLLDLVNDALDLAKLDVTSLEVVTQATTLRELVDDVLNDFVSQAAAKSVELQVDEQLDDMFYLADRNLICTILRNLVGNAVKFTDSGSVTVALAEDSYGQVEVAIRDTGIGIAPEFHDKIFKEFEQADATIARRFGGTGLGMSIVKRAVDRMDGTIALQSALGAGSCFTIALPLQPLNTGLLAA
ncbi:GAF domain-containing protein [Loktanella fryxellensis]|uniref:histidine kinase n=1 Tax=Loktanella fryxellensis TaxID=245187 RepID=A0A1H8IPN5_9RHOB|nr:GAF domain-containing sensor histidine kinase [Loktanella fryxellensis]SEN70643.1 GAF domain-containing protein [Loktanella fryxellensis]